MSIVTIHRRIYKAAAEKDYVGEPVTVRYQSRDMGQTRVFHRNVFHCRAVNAEHTDRNVILKGLQTGDAGLLFDG